MVTEEEFNHQHKLSLSLDYNIFTNSFSLHPLLLFFMSDMRISFRANRSRNLLAFVSITLWLAAAAAAAAPMDDNALREAPSVAYGSSSSTSIISLSTTRMPSKTKHTKGDSVEQFLKDMNHLKTLDNPLLTPTHTRTDSSYTRTWTNEDWVRHQVRSFFRYKRHCLSWTKSPTARAVLPTVFVVCLWASLVSLVTSRTPILQVFIQKASFFSGMAAFSAPISLLLALRTNRAMDRLLDARRQFGIMARAVLSLASLTTVYIAPVDLDKALLLGRYLCIYGWIMKGCVRGEDDTSVCRALLPPEEAQWLSNTFSDTPTSILLRLRQVIASVVDKLPLSAATAMEESICELETVLGVCKRLLGSPIPPTYTRHTSRVLCLFLGFLPVAMVGSGVSFLATLLNCALISYVFVGIDEIGVEIEHPFPLLPMYHLSSAIQNNVANQFLSMAMGPPQP